MSERDEVEVGRGGIHADWKWLLAVPVATVLNFGGMIWKAGEMKAAVETEIRVLTVRLDKLDHDLGKSLDGLRGDLRVLETRMGVLEREVYILKARADGKLPKAFTEEGEDP